MAVGIEVNVRVLSRQRQPPPQKKNIPYIMSEQFVL